MNESIFGGQGQSLGELYGTDELDAEAGEDGGVLIVGQEDLSEVWEETRNQRRDITVCFISAVYIPGTRSVGHTSQLQFHLIKEFCIEGCFWDFYHMAEMPFELLEPGNRNVVHLVDSASDLETPHLHGRLSTRSWRGRARRGDL